MRRLKPSDPFRRDDSLDSRSSDGRSLSNNKTHVHGYEKKKNHYAQWRKQGCTGEGGAITFFFFYKYSIHL